jgi:putative tryptophan/tyrosine transport system substrate-binding protein
VQRRTLLISATAGTALPELAIAETAQRLARIGWITAQQASSLTPYVEAFRIPVISGWPIFAESGALCTYGPDLAVPYRRLAYYVDRVLKGAKPAELPIEQPTKFELVLNLRSARKLGLTVPETILVRADKVIE